MNKQLLAKIIPVLSKIKDQISFDLGTAGPPEKKAKKQEIVEVEDKYHVDNPEKLKRKLVEKSFQMTKEVWQEETYLDFGQELRKIDQDIRLRKSFDMDRNFISGELKWEGTRGELQDRPVVEIKLKTKTDCDLILKLLKEKLGLEEFSHFFKHRLLYERFDDEGKIEAEFDSFDGEKNSEEIRGKSYLQIAMEVKPDKHNQAKEKVVAVIKELGLTDRDNRNYFEIAQGLERKAFTS